MISSSLIGVVAQRLVKKICPYCKTQYTPSDDDKKLVGDIDVLYKGKGCINCNNTGYKGRIAVHEILEIDGGIRQMISEKAPVLDIYDYVKKEEKLCFIRDNVRQLVIDGVTTLDELIKETAFSG